ncbi:MAG TPA: GNAT family N-acetyltransferase [Xanthobacteraceae bacterium]|nr:GNAT family N-acetyltransferase [Xanthobacteraceae bacterium]
MSDVDIRPAGPGDVAAITRIYGEAVAHGTATFEIVPPDESEMARRQQALLTNGYPYLVAEQAGAVAGYAYAGPYHARPAYRWSVEDSIYVAPQFHRLGLGRLLMARLIAEAQARGFRQMIAVIGDSANAASIALHAAAGFRRIGTLQSVGFKHGRWLDAVLMQRPLGSADTTPP